MSMQLGNALDGKKTNDLTTPSHCVADFCLVPVRQKCLPSGCSRFEPLSAEYSNLSHLLEKAAVFFDPQTKPEENKYVTNRVLLNPTCLLHVIRQQSLVACF